MAALRVILAAIGVIGGGALHIRPETVGRIRNSTPSKRSHALIMGPSLIRSTVSRGGQDGDAAIADSRITSREGQNGNAAIADSRIASREGQNGNVAIADSRIASRKGQTG